jgi:hypothetical protein
MDVNALRVTGHHVLFSPYAQNGCFAILTHGHVELAQGETF